MIRRLLPYCALGVASFAITAEADVTTELQTPSPSAVCGLDLHPRDVLVLDVQHLAATPDLADDYVLEHAGNYVLADPLIDEFRMPFRPTVEPGGVVKTAQKFGVKKGCDLVLILKTGPYFGKQRGRNARVKDHGYAFVAAGQRAPRN